jgi:hypothetical protein
MDDPLLQVLLLTAALAGLAACRLVALAARLLSALRRPRVLVALAVRLLSAHRRPRVPAEEPFTPRQIRILNQPRLTALVPTVSPPVRPVEDKQSRSLPAPAPLHGRERRSAPRRQGAAVRVEVADAEDRRGRSTPPPAPLRGRERRSAPRRQGAAVPVEVSDAEGEHAPSPGSVLDRSRGGLCLAVPSPAAVGEVVCVRSVEYADSCPWVRMEVRHCRPDAKRWLLSCRFVEDQPWSVLLLFG